MSGEARRHVWTKLRRIAGATMLSALGLVVILFLLLLMRPVREKVLAFGLSKVEALLPGTLTVEDASWSGLGSLDFHGIEWVDESDTLAAAGSISVSIGLSDLVRRDVRVHEFLAEDLFLDIPRI
jgi:hypothetical protein